MRPDNFETPSRASATINDPDWEHFDEIEAYTSNDDSGLLVRILPSIIYKHFLTPTDADADTVRHDREQISSCFDEIVEVHAQACQELDNTDQQEKIDTEVGDSQNYPVTADDLDDYNSLSTYLDEAKQLVECERDVHRLITHLLTKPEKAFLTSEEQAVLTESKEFFSRSATKGEERIEELRSRRRKLLEVLPDKTREWEHELNSLEAQAEPYLRLDEYLEDDNLLRKTRALEDELSSFAESNPVFTELSPRIKSQFFDLRERAQRLNSKLPETRSKYAENQFKCLTNSVQRRIDQLQERLQPSKEAGDPIQAPDEILTEIQNLQSKLSEFENRPLNKQFTDTQDNRLAGFEETLADLKRFTQEKQRFDSKLDNHTHTFQALSTDAEPYLNYDEYLPHRTREALIDRLIQFDAVMQEFVHKTQLSILSQHDADRVNNLQQQYSTIREHLDGYNSTFVRRQRENCTEIFSNIGSEDLELTVEQERAVIRNGIYNQVIAAAGTGKTLTLTTRVAYLIEQQNVDPADILVVTYTNEATEEMSERLEDQFGITNVTIETIHAFGYDLIQETQEQFVEPIDQNERQNFVDQQIREARNNESSAFLDHYYEFLVHFDDVYYDETEFETRKAYVEARLEETYVTLKGTEVKSRAEKLIADFLFTNQVEYRYEDRATWAESTRDKAGYTPDFYLPNHDLYIEHWGIDETGSVAPWFSQSSAEYREKIQWAHQQFSGTEHTLIGTYEFEHEANYLKQALRHRLTHHGVELTQLRFEELIDTAFEYDQREGWIKRRFGTFIENAKRFEMKPDDIKPHLSEENPRQYHFGYCGIHLLQQYEMYLTQNNLIDFQDMVHDAVDTIQQNPTSYKEQYEHVLVDEFQDIGKGKLELIQQLTGDDAARLFAVGDDWQSIYSFQGAVIDYFTEFSTYFGDPVRTELTANFRSPPTPIEAGNHLIEHNSKQIDKVVHPTRNDDHTPRVHVLRGYQFYDYVMNVREYTVTLVREYITAGAAPDDIMILCRYDAAVPYLSEIKDGLKSEEIPYVGKNDQYRGPDETTETGVSVYSLYQAKGREADHVILVHATEGPYGLPSNRRDGRLLTPVRPVDSGGLEEERRAFYVAITRTSETLDLLTRAEKKSQFLREIDEYTDIIDTGQVEPLDDVDKRMTITVELDQLLEPWKKQHQRGILADQYGGSARYVSWENTDPPTLNVGEWYQMSNLKVSEFKGEKELIWTDDSTLNQLSEPPSITTPPRQSTDSDDSASYTTGETNTTDTEPTKIDSGTSEVREAQSADTAIEQKPYEEVLSVLAELGGTASTGEIAAHININRDGVFDILLALETEEKVTWEASGHTKYWTLVE